jgi:tetratricopeptide (TPR) repeat protein
MVRVLVAALVVGWIATAAAQGPSEESTKLFEEGRALAKDGKYEEACAKFEKSLALDRAPGTLLNYGDCHEHLGHLALAWRLYDEAASASDKENNADRAKYARERAQALVPKTSTVVVRIAPQDIATVSLTINGEAAKPAAEVREVIDPGDVTVEVNAPGFAGYKKTERGEAGLKLVFEVPPLVATGSGGGGGGTPTGTTERRHSRVVAAYTLGGVGAASLVTGIIIGVTARSRYNAEFDNGNCEKDSPPRCISDGYTNQNNAIALANIGTVFGIGGLALIAGGAVVFLTAPRDVVVIPTATAQAGGLAVVGRF